MKNKKLFNILVRIFVPCKDCGIGGHYEYKKLETSWGRIYEFTEYEANKYIETYSRREGNIIKELIK